MGDPDRATPVCLKPIQHGGSHAIGVGDASSTRMIPQRTAAPGHHGPPQTSLARSVGITIGFVVGWFALLVAVSHPAAALTVAAAGAATSAAGYALHQYRSRGQFCIPWVGICFGPAPSGA